MKKTIWNINTEDISYKVDDKYVKSKDLLSYNNENIYDKEIIKNNIKKSFNNIDINTEEGKIGEIIINNNKIEIIPNKDFKIKQNNNIMEIVKKKKSNIPKNLKNVIYF